MSNDLRVGAPETTEGAERLNHALHEVVTQLPDGLFMVRRPGDVHVLLYPTEIVCAIQAAFDKRLLAEKSQHVDALDRINALIREIARLERQVDDLHVITDGQCRELAELRALPAKRSSRSKKS